MSLFDKAEIIHGKDFLQLIISVGMQVLQGGNATFSSGGTIGN